MKKAHKEEQILVNGRWTTVKPGTVVNHLKGEYADLPAALRESYQPAGVRGSIRTVRQVIVED